MRSLRLSRSFPARLGTAAIAALTLGTAPALAEGTLTVTHAQGETEIAQPPKPALVFPLYILDTLHALGVEVDGVADSDFIPDYISEYRDPSLTSIGTLFEPDYEAIAAAGPELVIVGGRSARNYDALAAIAPTIDLSFDPDDYMGSIERNTRTLGEIFGVEERAEAELAALEADIAAFRELSAKAGPGLLILTTGGKMSAYGPGSRFGIMHEVLGIEPARTDMQVGTHGQPVSNEFIMDTDPEWLFVIDRDSALGRDGETAQQLLDNPLIHRTRAWQDGHVVYLDPRRWYLTGGGLNSLRASIAYLTETLEAAGIN